MVDTKRELRDSIIKMHNDVLSNLSEDFTDYDIYHYTSPEGLQGIIESNKLRFTNRIYLNDKMEGKYALDLLVQAYDEIIEDMHPDKEEAIKQIKDYKENKIEKHGFKIFQCSFSCDKDNLSLWNYYTKDRCIKGYNINFSSKELCKKMEETIRKMNADISGDDKDEIENDKRPIRNFFRGKVIYEEKMQIKKLKSLFNKYKEIFQKCYKDSDEVRRAFAKKFDDVLDSVVSIGTLFKKRCFEIENEYRIAYNIRIDEDNKVLDKYIKFKVQNGIYVPYIDIDLKDVEIKGINISPTLDFEETKYSLKDFLLFPRNIEKHVLLQEDLTIGQSKYL